jgi:hypothetical protein
MEERLGHSKQERQEGGAAAKRFWVALDASSPSSRFYNSSSVIPHWCHLTYTCQDPSSSRPANRMHMADVTAKRDCRDRDRINIHQDYERVVVET